MSPEEAASYLAEVAYLLRQQGDAHRARAFTRAAGMLARDRPDLRSLRQAGQLASLAGVGASIAQTLAELVDTGRSSYLERLRGQTQPAEGGAPGEGLRPAGTGGRMPPSPEAGPGAPGQLALAGYRGDLHCHTDWSDGGATVLDMAWAARARGYQYLAITDHSPRIAVVNGLGPERLAAQRRQVEAAGLALPEIAVLQGCEVDILEDGSLDLPDEALAALDVVIASPHVKLRMEPAAMTERMLRAVGHPHVDVIGHPTGRRPGSRPGATYDFDLVFEAAAARGVALEIDCDPARMDLSPELARLACARGCWFALNSDAHAPDQFAYVDLGLWSARRAGVPSTRLLNWLPLNELSDWLRRRERRSGDRPTEDEGPETRPSV